MSGRYTILGTLASGGMGTVFLGRMTGSAGFSRLVAIKRLRPELAVERDFIAMLVDEARLTSHIRHPNVIDTIDLVAEEGAFSVVLEYVEGAALSALVHAARAAGERVPGPIAIAITLGMLRGLDAAHEARGEEGQPLGIVHRDVSPQNVLVGIDGIPRVIDFGIAKAMGTMSTTRPGEVRGKFAYMAPEQLMERPVTRQADVYAAGVTLWELLTGERLFKADDVRLLCAMVVRGEIRPPSAHDPTIPPGLDAVVLQATAREVSDRYLTARELIDALGRFHAASNEEVGAWVRRFAAKHLAKKDLLLQRAMPEGRRSVDDLIDELARSAAPGGTIPVAPNPVHDTSLQPGAYPTASGVEIATGSDRRTWWLVPLVAVVAMLGVSGLLLAFRYGLRGSPEPRVAAPPLAETAAAPPPPPTAVATSTAEPAPAPAPVESASPSPGTPPSPARRKHPPAPAARPTAPAAPTVSTPLQNQRQRER